jgi:hypothetical protein
MRALPSHRCLWRVPDVPRARGNHRALFLRPRGGKGAFSSLAFSRTSSSRRRKKAATSANDIPPRSDAIKKSKSVFSHDLPAFVSKCIEGGKRG